MTYERETTLPPWTGSRWNDGSMSTIPCRLSSSALRSFPPHVASCFRVYHGPIPPSSVSIARPGADGAQGPSTTALGLSPESDVPGGGSLRLTLIAPGSSRIRVQPSPPPIFVKLGTLAATPTAYKWDGPALQPARSTGSLLLLRQLFGGAVHMVEEVGDGHQREHAAKDTGGPRCQDEAIGEARGDPRSQAPGAGQ